MQINSKIVCRANLPANAANEEIEAKAIALPEVRERIADKTVKKCVVVPGRLVNLIVG